MRVSKSLAAWGIFGGAVLLSTGALVVAFNPQPDPPGHYYGLMTVQPGQRLALHVSNVKPSVADARRPAASMCVAELQVVNACGETLARSSVRIVPTESLSLNFMLPPDPDLPPDPCADPPGSIRSDVMADPPDDGVPPDPGKQRVRAQVVFTGEAQHCISSVEVGDPFVGDPTGLRTGGAFIHPGMIVGFNPQPDPPKVAR